MSERSKLEHVLYNGRLVPKQGFRVYIYNAHGEAKLVNSFAEFETHLAQGSWFTEKPALESSKPKRKGKPHADSP